VFEEESDSLFSTKGISKVSINNTHTELYSYSSSPESSTSLSSPFISVSGSHQPSKLGVLQVSFPSKPDLRKPFPTLELSSCMKQNTLDSTSIMGPTTLNPTCSSKNNITIDLTSSLDLNASDPTSLTSTSKNKNRQFNSFEIEDNVLHSTNREHEETVAKFEETEREDPGFDFSHLNPGEQAVVSQISKIIRGTYTGF
jgi:hypothetical protein